MESRSEFNLERALRERRHTLIGRAGLDEGEALELESHLRDRIDELVEKGATPRQAFDVAVDELGAEQELGEDFAASRRRSGIPEIKRRLVPSLILNYLTVAGRVLRRGKAYAAISIAGLAVGIACCVILLLFVREELAFDRYNEHADRIYRLTSTTRANTPEFWAPELEAAFPEVELAVRVKNGSFGRGVFINGDRRESMQEGLIADARVFDVFSWNLKSGDASTALAAPYTMVVSEDLAKRYFGSVDVIGRVVTIAGMSNYSERTDYTVTGVFEPIPKTSHIQADFIVSMQTIVTLNDAGKWGTPFNWTNPTLKTYLLLDPLADPNALLTQIQALLKTRIADDRFTGANLILQPLLDIHLRSQLGWDFPGTGSIQNVYLMSLLAFFLLLIACVNFINLSTARSIQRAREVGMRKALGAARTQLVGQFLSEAFLQVGLATVIGIGIAELLRPSFQQITGRDIAVIGSLGFEFVFGLALIAAIVTLTTGVYPAMVLSRYQPADVLKSRRNDPPVGSHFRQGLVVFQFVISIMMGGMTFI